MYLTIGLALINFIAASNKCQAGSLADGGSPKVKTQQLTQKEKARELIMSRQKANASTLTWIDFNSLKVHEPQVADTKESKQQFFSNKAGKGQIDIARVLEDGDKVAVQFSERINSHVTVNWAIFRFNKAGKIVELWSNSQANQKPNASARTMLDGTTQISDLTKTGSNKTRMQAFFDSVIVGNKFQQAAAYYKGDSLIQHDPHAGDGLKALMGYTISLAKAGTPQQFNNVHLLLGEGDFVLVCTDYTLAGKPGAYYELYRLKDNLIAERWLVDEPIQPKENWKNSWGKY